MLCSAARGDCLLDCIWEETERILPPCFSKRKKTTAEESCITSAVFYVYLTTEE